jgi:hypothetical protein
MVLIGIEEEKLIISDNGRFCVEDPRRFTIAISTEVGSISYRMTALDMQNLAYAMLELTGGGDAEEVLLEIKGRS